MAFTGVPSFVLAPGVPIRVGARELRVDVAFGGGFYAMVDVEAAGLAIVPDRLADLRRLGREIARAVEKAIDVRHPVDEHLRGIDGTVFTAPPESGDADLRALSVFGDGAVDRSPNGAGLCAVMAVFDAMGLLRARAGVSPGGPGRRDLHRHGDGQDARRRLRRDPARDRRVRVDHRRAHLRGGRR